MHQFHYSLSTSFFLAHHCQLFLLYNCCFYYKFNVSSHNNRGAQSIQQIMYEQLVFKMGSHSSVKKLEYKVKISDIRVQLIKKDDYCLGN